jgi:hypothetical protein
MRYAAGVLGCVALLAGFAPPLSGQTASFQGRLLADDTEEPIAGGRIILLDDRERRRGVVMTDDNGVFRFASVPPGGYRFQAARIGYASTTTPRVVVQPNERISVEIRLAEDVVLLAPIEVTAKAHRPSPVLDNFRVRRERGFGRFLGREEIARRNAPTASDLFAMVPGVRLGPSNPRGGRMVYMAGALGGNCPAQIYVDGFLVNPPLRTEMLEGPGGRVSGRQVASELDFTVDEVVRPMNIEGIEIFRGLSEVPAEFMGPNARCGVIAVWTRRGERTTSR